MLSCSSCGAENRPGARFCEACGAALGARCPACGAEHRAGARFCDACGTALAAPEPAVGAPGPVAAAAAESAAELRVVSVLFVDLVGYTALSESRDPEDARELLSRYFETARTIAARYGGVVEKFIGDAVMAVWGTPTAREDDAERAVRAGLELVEAVAAFGAAVGAPELRARAGVVTGQVAAVVGAGEALVVGDRVNTASRVQSLAAPGSVYVDEVTRGASAAAIAYEDTGEHRVRGKAEPLRLWRAVRVVAGAGGAQREEGLQAPFLGRDAELRLRKDLLHQGVDRGTARLVAVSGAAGVGKSRLRREFEHYSDGLAQDILWHSGRCLSYGDGVAYWALAEMVRQRLGIAEEAPPGEAARKLQLGLERWIVDPEERAYLRPRLATLIGSGDRPEQPLAREDLFAGWRLFFERLATHSPVALVFEDLQWADDGLLDFIEHLLEWSAQHPIFVLALSRPELAERRAGWPPARPGVQPVYLEPLPADDLAAVLDALVEGLPAGVRDRIVTQAEGVPLYALETVRALADRGVLAAGAGDRLVVRGEIGALDVPATLSSLLTARLDALDADERALVKDLSVMGGTFPRGPVLALTGLPEARVDALLAGLVRKQVLIVRADPLSPDRGQYGFAQTLLRTVAYDLLSRHERKARHVAIARHLRASFPNEGEEIAEVIAAHLLDAYRAAQEDPDAGELRAEALAALRRAAARAEALGAPDAAERACRTALELSTDDEERLQLTEMAGRMAMQAGRHFDALTLLEPAATALEGTGRPRDAARLEELVGEALMRSGQAGAAARRMRAALARLGEGTPVPEAAALHLRLAQTLTFAGEPGDAAASVERGLEAAAALGLPSLVADGLITRGIVHVMTGRLEEAIACTDGAIGMATRHGLGHAGMRAQTNGGDARLRAGLPGAEELMRAALARSQQRGDRAFAVVNVGNLMQLHTLTGRWDEVDRLAEDFQAGGLEEWLACWPIVVAVLRDQPERIAALLPKMAAWRASDMGEERLMVEVLDAIVAAARDGDAAPAGALLPLAREAFAADGVNGEQFRLVWPEAVQAALAAGRRDAAAELVALIEGVPAGHVGRYLQAQLRRARGLLAAAGGEHEAAEGELRAAVTQFEALGYAYWLAVARTDLAAWLLGRGRSEAAAELEGACATLEALGARPALARARALLAAAEQQPAPAG
jgi:class 3 adenylate cyclase/tetratricopeptide (TPR) repeat protein